LKQQYQCYAQDKIAHQKPATQSKIINKTNKANHHQGTEEIYQRTQDNSLQISQLETN
jgi:hypothetical protein